MSPTPPPEVMDADALVAGFEAAAERENRLRLRAFCGEPYPCEALGQPLRLLTLRDTVMLQLAENPLYCGGPVDAVSALQALYIVSKARDDGIDARIFSRRAAKSFSETEICAAAIGYVEEMFADSGAADAAPVPKKRKPPRYVNASVYVDEIASAYGWGAECILSLPVAQIYQYLHLIREGKNPRYRWRQLSDAAADKIVKARAEARKRKADNG